MVNAHSRAKRRVVCVLALCIIRLQQLPLARCQINRWRGQFRPVGYTYALWTDHRNAQGSNPTGSDPYFARINLPPAPPQNLQMSLVQGQGGHNYPKVTWTANVEPDLAAYEVWRKVTGVCGNGAWYTLDTAVISSVTEYTDWSISTATHGNNICQAEYKLKAKDAVGNKSDFSSSLFVGFGSDEWKVAAPREATRPLAFAFHGAYPNPFNPSTQIRFDVPEDSHVSLNVIDVLGRKVAEIVNHNYAAGYHSTTWNATNLASGVYFLRFAASDGNGIVKFSKMSKLVLTK